MPLCLASCAHSFSVSSFLGQWSSERQPAHRPVTTESTSERQSILLSSTSSTTAATLAPNFGTLARSSGNLDQGRFYSSVSGLAFLSFGVCVCPCATHNCEKLSLLTTSVVQPLSLKKLHSALQCRFCSSRHSHYF